MLLIDYLTITIIGMSSILIFTLSIKNTSMSIFITGSSGMLGAYLLKSLLKDNCNSPIYLSYRSDEKKQLTIDFLKDFNISDKSITSLNWLKGDLLDQCFVEDIIKDEMTVYHCAAIVSFNKKEADFMIESNVRITENLVNICLEKKDIYFLHVSSIAAIGRENVRKVVTEENQWTNSDANSAYAISKNLSEMEVWRGFQEGLKGSIINPSIILGVFPKSISSLKIFEMAKNEFPFYTLGENGFVDVYDVVKSMRLLAEKQILNERYIISMGNYSYQNIFNLLADNLDKKRPKYKTTMMLGRIALFLEFIQVIFGKSRKLSMDLLKTSLQKNHYDNSKFINAHNFKYDTLENCLEQHSKYYKTLL